MKFENMFSPIQIGPMEVKNRFVVPPMGNNFANTDGTMSDQSVAYYGARAKGGFGLITLEATVVHKGAKGGPRKPCLMCSGAIIQSHIQRVVYGASDTRWMSLDKLIHLPDPKLNYIPMIQSDILKDKCSKLIKDYFKKKRQKI